MTVTQAPPAPEAAPPPPRRPSAWTPEGRERLAGALPIAVLVLIPVAVFGGAVLVTGHPLLIGDNLIQSYPLHVLVGDDFRHLQWPFWDPWIWSGTPLMAGMYAGTFYPATFLFAVMPAAGAWVLGQILIWSSISVGTYLFLGATGTRRMPSFLGAFSFAFAGAVAAQGAVHIDMAAGFASLPWMLLAVRRIVDEGRWRWCLLLGAATACLVVAGAPEAILDVSILCLVYGLMRLWLKPAAWSRLALLGGSGVALGVGLSAFVWMPAVNFITTSQRGTVTKAFAASYSFPTRDLVLGLVPFLQGGWSALAEPRYFGLSNLAEVSFYVGMLPILAAIALAGRRWKDWLPKGERRTWYLVGLVGLLLAVGAKTPLDNVIWHIPFYGKQRNQGRNIVDVDFAACVLLAWWLDGGSRRPGTRSTSERVAGAVLVVLTAGVFAWLAAAPASLWRVLRAVPPSPSQLHSVEASALVALALALGAATLTFVRPRVRPGRWIVLATVFIVLDVGLYASGTSFAATQSVPTSSDPGSLLTIVARNLSPGGRYAVFDPDLFYTGGSVEAGEADLNVLVDLPSVQGYGAVLGAAYALHTATHVRGDLAVGELQHGYYAALDLEVLLAPPEAFLTAIAAPPAGAPAHLTPLAEGAGTDPLLPAGNETPPQEILPVMQLSRPRARTRAGERVGWFFGTLASPTAVSLVLSRPDAGQLVRLGLITPTGAVSWQPPQRLGSGSEVASLPLATTPAAGMVVRVLSGPALGPTQLVIEVGRRAYVVNGPLASALTPASWTYVGWADHFAAFRDHITPEAAWVQAHRSFQIAVHQPAQVRVLWQGTDGATIVVRTGFSSMLVRSLAWDSGWHAEIVSGTDASRDLAAAQASPAAALSGARSRTVFQVGVMQAVNIPGGLSIVQLTYEPDGFGKGLLITGVTLVLAALGLLAGVFLARRRRKALRQPGTEPQPTG